MTRDEALVFLECKNYKELADRLLLTTAALAKWKDEVPPHREDEIRQLKAGIVPTRLKRLQSEATKENLVHANN
ncbi:ribonuclease D [Acinetobacter soli]|uniref:ribonuclease D n=1 Tax=Acinetobacter soli TaxID=487316 RepID=UPI001250049D|nr:ribonuclease D [Acinetobacter soli]